MRKQGRNAYATLCMSFILLVSMGMIGGCSSNSNPETTLQGWVSAGEPVSGANVIIYDTGGQAIYQTGIPATGELGSFLIAVKDLPASFRVVAKGGNLKGGPFPSELMADYRDFDPQTSIIWVNAVTTMASAYLDKHPDTTLAGATAIVKNFLTIPEWVDIGSGLNASGQYFSHSVFIEEAATHGGVSQYIDQLVVQIGSGTSGATYAFTGETLNGPLGGAGEFIAEELAKGALSYAGGKLLGWGLSKIGIGFGDETAEAIKHMQQQLVEISNKLDALDTKLTQIYNDLSHEIKQNNYDIRVGQMSSLISTINTIRQKITHFVSNPPANKALLEIKRQEIINLIRDRLLGNEDLIHSQLSGLAGQTPLLKVWSQVVKTKHRFLSKADSVTVKDQYDYFETLQGWLLQLLVEYYHAIGEGADYHQDIDDALSGYNGHIATQKTFLLKTVPDNAYLDRDGGIMIWLPADFTTTMADYSSFYMAARNKISWGMNHPNYGRGEGVLGFSNWRFPTYKEMTGLFAGWSGSPVQYVQSQGLNRIVNGLQLGASDYTLDQLECNLCKYSVWYCYSDDASMHSFHYDYDLKKIGIYVIHVMPVRTMGAGEFATYFW